jgi:hypothetical protein
MTIELPKQFEARIASITDRELQVRGQKRGDLRAYYEKRVLDDQANSPAVGAPAPDVRLELLSADGARTGDYKSISDFRGLPVGLIFGSFT